MKYKPASKQTGVGSPPELGIQSIGSAVLPGEFCLLLIKQKRSFDYAQDDDTVQNNVYLYIWIHGR